MADGFRQIGPLRLSSVPGTAVVCGYRSVVGFWFGGLCSPAGAPPVEEAGGYHQPPRGKRGTVHLPETYYHSTDDEDILSVIVSWTLKQ